MPPKESNASALAPAGFTLAFDDVGGRLLMAKKGTRFMGFRRKPSLLRSRWVAYHLLQTEEKTPEGGSGGSFQRSEQLRVHRSRA